MNIRPSKPADTLAWANLRNQLWPSQIEDHIRSIEQYFAGHLHEMQMVFVAEQPVDGLVGFIELNLRSYAEGSQADAVPYVEGWYVAASYRGQGIGQLLINQAESWALDLGYTELASDTESSNTISIDIHKKLGFQEVDRIVCFIKTLKRKQ